MTPPARDGSPAGDAHDAAAGGDARDGRSVTVLQVCTRLNVGGPARHLDGLARELPERYRTEVAAGPIPRAEGSLPVHAPTFSVPMLRRPAPSTDLAAYRRLRDLIATRRPAVVSTHTAKAGVVGRLAAARAADPPVTVHTFHGHLLVGYFPPAVRRAIVEVERRLARRTDALIAVSPEVRDELLGVGIGDPDRWHVLPIALDLAPFAARASGRHRGRGELRARLGLAPGTPLIGAVGRLAAVKDLGVLLRAARELPEVHVALVGDGPERAALTDLAHELGVADRTHITGWWQDVAPVYADLDVVVLTSRNEGTPSALIEASAAGRPIVATDVGGVRHVLDGGPATGGPGGPDGSPRSEGARRRVPAGWLVAPGPSGAVAAAVAAAVRDVLSRPERAADDAEAARRDVLARFDARRSAAAHAALFDELLARHRDRHGRPRR